ncbi:MAG: hypothetical protein ACK5S9_07240, partial [Roseiflexaceae bacterium]
MHALEQHQLPRWLSLLCLTIAVLLTATVIAQRSFKEQWSPTQQTYLDRDWLFQSAFSELELHDGEPARWLVNQPKRSDRLMNQAIDDTFVRFASAISPTEYGSYSIRLHSPE